MSRVRREKVVVWAPEGTPRAFRQRQRCHRVRLILDTWREVGDWWRGEGEWVVFRLETTEGGLYELAYDTVQGHWLLTRVYD